jgi:gamma-glutamylcyclotransferase
MDATRLGERIEDAVSVGSGLLHGWRFVCNKTGSDGSAKANIERDPHGEVWGVIYSFDEANLARLDQFEGGYRRLQVEVLRPGAPAIECATYFSHRITSEWLPFGWYKQHMLTGAVDHGLPAEWLDMLRAIDTRQC